MAISIEMRSDARVEDWIIFELDDCLFTCIERRAAALKDAPPSVQTREDPVLACLFEFGRNGPCATVNDECKIFHKGKYMTQTTVAAVLEAVNGSTTCTVGAVYDRPIFLKCGRS